VVYNSENIKPVDELSMSEGREGWMHSCELYMKILKDNFNKIIVHLKACVFLNLMHGEPQ